MADVALPVVIALTMLAVAAGLAFIRVVKGPTLPDRVIDALGAIDPDLSRAVVRLAQPELAKQPHPPVELATFGRHSVIVVSPTRTLDRQPGVSLVHLPDGRALISFDRSMKIAELELLLSDAVDGDGLSKEDRRVFQAIAAILRAARRSETNRLAQRSIIVVETTRRTRHRRTA